MSYRLVIAAGLFLAAIRASHAAGPVNAVRTYDENVIQTNTVDVNATPLTVAQMTANVAAAFDSGRGGVIDFDNGSFTDARSIDARFAAGAKSLRLTNSAHDWQIGVLGSSSLSGAISGPNVIFNGAPTPFPTPFLNSIVFGDVTDPISGALLPERVTSFGFTIIDSNFNNSSNKIHVDVTFSNGGTTSTNYIIPLAFQTQDTFFGWSAPLGAYITNISFTANNNTAGEDWAFITSPVPEPTTASALIGMGLIGVLLTRLRIASPSPAADPAPPAPRPSLYPRLARTCAGCPVPLAFPNIHQPPTLRFSQPAPSLPTG